MPDTAAHLGTEAAARLAAAGTVVVESGLSDTEFIRVEQMLGFEFADDHRAFLSAGLPVGTAWPDWRTAGRKVLQRALRMPLDGVLFEVEWSGFWFDSWGQRPSRMKDALRSANYHLARVPQLIPVHSHHYLPAGRGSSGQPVLSVVQTAVVAYGANLLDYVEQEFGPDEPGPPTAVPTVKFWSDLIS